MAAYIRHRANSDRGASKEWSSTRPRGLVKNSALMIKPIPIRKHATPQTGESQECFGIGAVHKCRHQDHENGAAESRGRHHHTAADPAHPFLFRGFEKLFDLRQDVFGDFL